MVEELFTLVKSVLETGGPAVITLLMIICAYLGWEKYQLRKAYDKQLGELLDHHAKQSEEYHKNLMEILDRYQEGQISVIQAINDVKVFLATIGAKL